MKEKQTGDNPTTIIEGGDLIFLDCIITSDWNVGSNETQKKSLST